MRSRLQRAANRAPVERRELPLTIEKPIYGGNFLARVDGKTHFIPFVIPGEEVIACAIEEKQSFARCKLVQVEKPAAERISPRCPHFTRCGGCDYQHTDYQTQIHWKRAILEETFTRAGIALPSTMRILATEPWHYRNRIRLAVDEGGHIGYRERNSHRVVKIRECPIAAPQLMAAAREFESALSQLPTIGVDEIELFAAPSNAGIIARVDAHSPRTGWLQRLAPLANSITGAELAHSADNAIIEQRGVQSLTCEIAGFRYEVANGAFFQVNNNLLNDFVECVAGLTDSSSNHLAWDLYCGVGLFAKRLLVSFKHVVAVESAPPAVESLRANLASGNALIVEANVEAFLSSSSSAAKPDLVIADPPRAGLGTVVAQRLNQSGARKILYISCDPATMVRDLRQFVDYSITSLTMADLFPQTFHLETIAVLELK